MFVAQHFTAAIVKPTLKVEFVNYGVFGPVNVQSCDLDL